MDGDGVIVPRSGVFPLVEPSEYAEGFRALASCAMPVEEVEACWEGTRARLGGR